MDKKAQLLELLNFYTNGNKAAFARMLGVTPQTVHTWIARNTFDAELILAKCDGISAQWLLTGEGAMLNTPDQRPSATIEEKTEPPPRNAFRYYYDMDASAGQGALCDTEENRPFELLNIPGFSGCVGFNVIGESMYPTAKPHDIVAIDPAPITTIVDGEIYMLVTNDGQRMIKRLAMIGRYTEEGKVLCMSDNPDKHRYRDFEVSANEISYTYRVRGFISITRTG